MDASNQIIYIPASKVSAITGRNRYQSKDKALIEVLANYNKKLYKKLTTAYNEVKYKYEPIYEEAKKVYPFIEDSTDNIMNKLEKLAEDTDLRTVIEKVHIDEDKIKEPRSSEDGLLVGVYHDIKEDAGMKEMITQIVDDKSLHQSDIIQYSDKLDSKVSSLNVEIPDIKDKLVHQLYMDRGCRQESSALKLISSKYGLKLKVDTTHLSMDLKRDKIHYRIGGRVDSYILNDRGQRIGVIEVKTRTRGAYGKVRMPIYDLDQLAVYYGLTGLSEYYICEYFNGDVLLVQYNTDELRERWMLLRGLLDNVVHEINGYDINPYGDDIISMIDKYTYSK